MTHPRRGSRQRLSNQSILVLQYYRLYSLCCMKRAKLKEGKNMEQNDLGKQQKPANCVREARLVFS